MRHRYLLPALLFVLFLPLLSSCGDEVFPQPEDRLVGVWKYEKVKYRKNWSLETKDITHDYDYNEWHFMANGDVMYINTRFRDTQFGSWNYRSMTPCTSDEDGTDCQQIDLLDMNLIDGNSVITYTWENVQVNKHKIRGTEYLEKGRNRVVLNKK